jgi:hypothetical protein
MKWTTFATHSCCHDVLSYHGPQCRAKWPWTKPSETVI